MFVLCFSNETWIKGIACIIISKLTITIIFTITCIVLQFNPPRSNT